MVLRRGDGYVSMYLGFPWCSIVMHMAPLVSGYGLVSASLAAIIGNLAQAIRSYI